MVKSRRFQLVGLFILLGVVITLVVLKFPPNQTVDAAELNAIGSDAEPDVILSDSGFSPAQMDIQAGMSVAFHNETTNNYTLVGIPLAGLPLYKLYLPIVNQQDTAQNQNKAEPSAGNGFPGPTSCAFQVPFPVGAVYLHKYTDPGVCGYALVDSSLSGSVTVNHAFGPATLTGRLLDTTSVLNGDEDPIIGATVSLLGTTYSAVSDANGYFTIANITPPGTHVLDINTTNAQPAPDGSPYASFREEFFVIGGMPNIVERPFYLPRIDPDSLTTVIPSQTTTVNNPNLDITMTVPPNTAFNEDGTLFTGQLSISEVPQGLAPAMMPPELQSGLLITVQPVGVTFNTPAPITFPNFDNLAVGNELDLWSLDPETGSFVVVGTGEVVQNGSEAEIQIIEGGIRAADWHFFLPPAGNGTPPENQDNKGGVPPQECPGGSTITVYSGCMKTNFSLPSYTSIGETHALSFVYKADRAYSQTVLPFNVTIPVRAAVPPKISYQLSIAGMDWGDPIYLDTTGLNENQDETLRGTVTGDTSYLATGSYPYNLQFTSHYANSQISSNSGGSLMVVNDQDSPFGAGWQLAELQRLFIQSGGEALLVAGNGTVQKYEPAGSYFNDFEYGAGSEWSNNVTDSTPIGDRRFLGQFSNGAISLTLDQLPPHMSIFVEFDLFIMKSWDGNGNPSGDIWDLSVDEGQTLLHTTFSNIEEAPYYYKQAYPDDYPGGNNYALTGAEEIDSLGYTYWGNSVYHLAYTFPHQQDTVKLNFSGLHLQGVNDESWGIDNINLFLVSNVSIPKSFRSPNGDYSTLLQNEDGTYILHLPDGTEYHFSSTGLQTSMVDRNGNTTTYTYNANDRLTTITDPAGIVTTFIYTDGLLSSVSNPGGTTTFQHDTQGNLTTVTFPDGSGQTFGYDPHHLMTSETDPNDKQTLRTYNQFGQLTSALLPGEVLRSTTASQLVGWVDLTSGLGTEENPAPITRPEEAVSTFMDGEDHSTTFVTGQFGEATQITDPAGLITSFARDADGNPTQTTLPSGAVFDRTFDDQGNLLTFTDQTLGGTTTFTYEPVFNQLTTFTNPFEQTTTFDYNANGNLTQITTPLSRTVTFSYNDLGLVTHLTDSLGTLTAYTYNTQGNLTTLAQGTGADQRTASLTYTAYIECDDHPHTGTTRVHCWKCGRLPWKHQYVQHHVGSRGDKLQLDIAGRVVWK